MASKDELRKEFSKDYKRHYEVPLFGKEGFSRFTCKKCGKGYWALEEGQDCGDSAHREYSFFREKPRVMGYADFWKKFADFWKKNGHSVIPRYPVLSRWRDDLYFTIASIVDFQRLEAGRIVFEYPENPLMVPQICLRFPDIANIDDRCLPVTPMFAMSGKRRQICGTISGFAGYSKTILPFSRRWKSTMLAIVKYKSSRHLLRTG